MSESHLSSPPSKRVKLEPSPSPPPELLQGAEDIGANDANEDNIEEEHCTICLQSFIDRTIIPTCAHEFCFECILLWSEQSRKCPLCSRSFDNSYLIHRIRSEYDYQKHYLPPSRTSPPLLTGESRARVLRNTRRERQWGRRERQRREEADQLERAISRRRWIYQHHLYAKHIASNPYTRYRPFPTPAQFAASPDLISRMTIFLRRELRVWPNLDVEFLTTYIISLMKSIDIRSESAVKLLSEFLDLDTPYIEGVRHVNAEHFAHEIYSYLRSPYRDLKTYDQVAQYDVPSEISPPQEIEGGSRWHHELPPRSYSPLSPSRESRSRSNSRVMSPIPQRENRARYSPPSEYPSSTSAEDDVVRPSHRHRRSRSPQDIRPGHWGHDLRNRVSRPHSPPDRIDDYLRNTASSGLEALSSTARPQDQITRLSTPLQSPADKKGKGNSAVNTAQQVELIAATSIPQVSNPQGDDPTASAAISSTHSADITRPAPATLEASANGDSDHVDKVHRDSSANFVWSRKSLARLGDTLGRHPRNRTLSESIQAHLSLPIRSRTESAKEHSTLSGVSPSTHPPDKARKSSNDTPAPLRISAAPTHSDLGNLNSARKTNVEMSHNHPPLHSEKASDNSNCLHSEFLGRCSSGGLNTRPTRSTLPGGDDTSASVDRSPDHPEFPPFKVSTVAERASHVPPLGHASASSEPPPSSSATHSSESLRTQRRDTPRVPSPRTGVYMASEKNHPGRPDNKDTTTFADDRRSSLLRQLEDEQRQTTMLRRDRTEASGSAGKPGKSDAQSQSHVTVSRDGDVRRGDEVAEEDVIDRDTPRTSTPSYNTSANALGDASDLESRLRTRALVRVRLAAMKGVMREASDPDPDPENNDHDEAGSTRASKSPYVPISSEREEALRGLLRERRT